MKRPRLFWQIYTTVLSVTAIVLAIFLANAKVAFKHFFEHQTLIELTKSDRILTERLRSLWPLRNEKDQSLFQEKLKQELDSFANLAEVRVTFMSPTGEVWGETGTQVELMNNHSTRPEFQEALRDGVGHSVRYSNTLGRDFFYYASLVKQDDKVIAVLRLAVPMRDLDTVISPISHKIIYSGILLVIVSAILVWPLTKRITSPIEKLRAAVLNFKKVDGQKAFEIGDIDSEEVRDLSKALNELVDRLDIQVKKISAQRNEREAIFSSMTEGVITIDLNGNLLHWNKAACSLLGVDYSGMMYKEKAFVDVFKVGQLEKIIEDTLKQGDAEEELTLFGNKILNVTGLLLKGENATTIGVLLVIHDVSRIRKLEGHRKDFAANVGHELRTPLTAIQGFIETLLEGVDDQKTSKRFLTISLKHTHRLKKIIDDLMLLSNLEKDAESLSNHFHHYDLTNILDTVLEICHESARERGVTLELVKMFLPGMTLWCHRELLEQALINLTENAIKYGPEKGLVTIRAMQNTDHGISFQVQDEGAGIPREHRERIFERFFSIDKARSRETGGSGLGLSIVKHIAILHTGTVYVQGAEPKGALFSLLIPNRA